MYNILHEHFHIRQRSVIVNKKHIICVIVVFFVGVAGLLFYFNSEDSGDVAVVQDKYDLNVANDDERASGSDEKKQQCSDVQDDKGKAKSIFVHVCGEVNKPGVYEMGSNSRIVDAIKAAKGLRKDAASNYINQALLLSDRQQIYVPSKKEVKNGTVPKSLAIQNENDSKNSDIESTNDNSNKVNINTASKEELMTINGIGSARADSILEYRKSGGKFSSIEDIKNVKGIKDGLFKKISEYITVN